MINWRSIKKDGFPTHWCPENELNLPGKLKYLTKL